MNLSTRGIEISKISSSYKINAVQSSMELALASASAHPVFSQLILKEQRKGVEEAVGAVEGIMGADDEI